MFFDNWTGILRVVVVGPLAYAGLVLMLRISGNRTLAKMNAFDLIVTVALGSTLATALMMEDVALLEGFAGFFTLIFLQWVVAKVSVHWEGWHRVVNEEPRLLLSRGRLLEGAMKKARMTPDEVRAAIREQGLASLEQVAAVVLETNGRMSVIPVTGAAGNPSAMEGVTNSTDPKD